MEKNYLTELDEEFTYYQTMDYDRFKFFDFNRIIGSNVKLSKSMDIVDMTKFVPIIVTPDFYIIDGQNRFLQCKNRGLPIYYIIYSGNIEDAMIALNTAVQTWKQPEWLHYYVTKGHPVYQKLNELHIKFGTTLSNSILLFSNGKSNSSTFKRGKLVEDSKLFEPVVNFINSVSLPQSYKNYRAFVNGVLIFMGKYGNDKKRIEKLRKRIISLVRFSKVEDYVNAFENLTKSR